MDEKKVEQGCEIPVISINAGNIPQAHHRAVKAVLGQGMSIRTQYDRKNEAGEFIDPPSRDATVMIHISNPFNQPRYPCVSFVERGAYIAEIMRAKDHRVLPLKKLEEELAKGGKLESKEWPYSYSQRLIAHPSGREGVETDQLEYVLGKLAGDPITRRAVATTRLPFIDTRIKEDLPCLGELHFRCTEHEGRLFLNMTSYWRSRDLYKAWPDNVIALTFLQQVMARRLSEKMNRAVNVGGYTDTSTSLHIYGQDMGSHAGGVSPEDYATMSERQVLDRAKTSQDAAENEVIPQLDELLSPAKIKEWGFQEEQLQIIRKVKQAIERGQLLA